MARGRQREQIRIAAAGLSALLLATAACSRDVEEVPDVYRPTNAHAAYRQGLIEMDLSNSALGRDWIEADERALRAPIPVTSPFRESGYFDAASATAVAYTFSVTRGQRVDAEVRIDSNEPLRVFVDMFRLVDDDPLAPVHVATGAAAPEPTNMASADEAQPNVRRLRIEPLRDGTYLLRVQPELLRSARYTVLITVDASLSFPVAGHSSRSIQSGFGAERDAGRRSHHGVDIFAPRGTPVLAASDGIVSRANTTPVGGNVVWVNDAKRNMRLYYAHLDSHSVVAGQEVKVGDQLGTVGNTGNAITTPTHLHFGVYARGPVDPYPFLARQRTDPEEIGGDAELLGGWSRTIDAAVEVLRGPERRAPVVGTLSPHTPLRVWGASARWYRVTLPEGGSGYVATRDTEPATPLRSAALADSARVLDQPASSGNVIDELAPGSEVPVLGEFGEFLYIRTPAGRNGWLAFD
jgi:murein DD-endopeptidase MepM/ murein hydrolase activator NlpD